MLAIDSSTLIAYLAGEAGRDVDVLDRALHSNEARLPPVVITETLSGTAMADALSPLLSMVPPLSVAEGYWERAGMLRRRLLAKGHKAALVDALICQTCLDHDLPLLTRDAYFKHFAKYAGLTLA